MDWRAHIWIDAERMHGTACLRGTRIRVIVLRPRNQSIRAILRCLDGAIRALATEQFQLRAVPLNQQAGFACQEVAASVVDR